MMTPLKEELDIDATGSCGVSIKFMKNLSDSHLQCALLNFEKCREIESLDRPGFTPEQKYQYYKIDQAYAIGSILTSVAFLEASINEFYKYCKDGGSNSNVSVLTKDKRDKLEKIWIAKYENSKQEILQKHESAFACLDVKNDKTDIVNQNAEYLVKLRHLLTHYKPELQSGISQENIEHKDLTKLQNYLQTKITENPFEANKMKPFFPDRCIGAGCAKWAITAAIDYYDNFYTKIGVRPNINTKDVVSKIER